MANRRMLSKSISVSKKVNRDLYQHLKAEGKDPCFGLLLFSWLIPHTDDFGRIDGDPYYIKHQIIPALPLTEDDIEVALNAMDEVGLIVWYNANGGKVIQIIDFDTHQKGLDKRTKSKFPPPQTDEVTELDASEKDIENYIYSNIEEINGEKIISKERQVRIGNQYLDIVIITKNQKWVLELKRSRISNKAESQLTNYLDLVPNSKGILIGYGVAANYHQKDKRINVYTYDDNMIFTQITLNNVTERSKMLFSNLTKPNLIKPNLTEEKIIENNFTLPDNATPNEQNSSLPKWYFMQAAIWTKRLQRHFKTVKYTNDQLALEIYHLIEDNDPLCRDDFVLIRDYLFEPKNCSDGSQDWFTMITFPRRLGETSPANGEKYYAKILRDLKDSKMFKKMKAEAFRQITSKENEKKYGGNEPGADPSKIPEFQEAKKKLKKHAKAVT